MSQQQKTEAITLELPDLTPKQLEFFYGVKAGMSPSAAYRNSYDASGMSDAAIWVEASKLKAHPKITLWLQALSRDQITAAGYTHDKFIADLEELKALSIKSGNMGAAVNATVNMGKSTGHMVEKTEVTHKTDKSELDQALDMLKQAGMDVQIPEVRH